ncbi:hypothetical protein CDL12_06900 [Handroanthus impetiginosus]|uniref:Uncharacterized protein n=1 Tax=Handroanthus impetiginosus TaxID=429701 RepID=A0A2G9HT03_9LAMI|nr:hypothetical protein CDL12_06900 [Handroanthus impetiginosus]
MNRLAPVSEEPLNEENSATNSTKKAQTWRNWFRDHFPQLFHKKSGLKILLSVLGCPLFPVLVHPKHHISQVSSRYLVHLLRVHLVIQFKSSDAGNLLSLADRFSFYPIFVVFYHDNFAFPR